MPAGARPVELRVPLEHCAGINFYMIVDSYNNIESLAPAKPVDVLGVYKMLEIDSDSISDYKAADLKAAVMIQV